MSSEPIQQKVLYERTQGMYPPGDFYVEEHECINCGVPAHFAPDLIRHRLEPDGDGPCYFYKQPSTPAEIDQAIAAVEGSCVCAVRYRGSDPAILARISNLSIDRPHGLVAASLVMQSNSTPPPMISTPQPGLLESLFRRFK